MGKRLIPIIALVMTIVPVASFALGLGPITMRSALNQPLFAEIDLHSIQPGDLDGLGVRLATVEDFQRVNVERLPFLTRFRFQVLRRNDGSAYVKLTTTKAITEPYLDFLIEAKWPRGRALKEYTVLVDPPVLSDENPTPVRQAEVSPVFAEPEPEPEPIRATPTPRRAIPPARSKPQPRFKEPEPAPEVEPEPTPRATRRPPARPPAAPIRQAEEPAEGTLNYGVVQRNDTLWEIAQQMRPEDVTVQQMMLALLKANPRAFIRGNINLLKAGYVLRIDDPDVLYELEQTSAVSEVRRQTQQWRARKSGRLVRQVEADDSNDFGESEVSESAVSESAVDEEAESGSREQENARLVLAKPGKEGAGSRTGGDSETATKLKEELIVATEALDASRQESDEIQGRMSELEEQLDSMQRLIMLKDEEMLSLQNQLGKKPEITTDQSQPEKDKPAPQDEPESAAGIDFMSDTVLFGGAVLLIIGLVAWMIIRRRRMHDGFEESILNVGAENLGAAAAASGFAAGSMTAESSPDSSMSSFAVNESGQSADAADVDPISEADVYLAYGRHQQAEDIIKQAIDQTPDRLELRSKLLEVFHAANNRAGFEEQASIVHEQIGGDTSNEYWGKIAELGAQICPDNALFSDGAADDLQTQLSGGVSAEDEDLLDFDFDEDVESTLMQGGGGDAATGASNADESLDFDVSSLDFDLDLDSDNSSDSAATAIESMDDDNSIDFDMSALDGLTADSSDDAKPAEDADNVLNFDGFEGLSLEGDSDSTSSTAEEEFSLSLDDDSGSMDMASDSDDFDMDLGMDDSDAVVSDTAGLNENVTAFDGSDDGASASLDDFEDDDIFADVDEIGTKLDLAKAYVDMGDSDGARSILDEVIEEGDDTQKQQAEALLQQMG